MGKIKQSLFNILNTLNYYSQTSRKSNTLSYIACCNIFPQLCCYVEVLNHKFDNCKYRIMFQIVTFECKAKLKLN